MINSSDETGGQDHRKNLFIVVSLADSVECIKLLNCLLSAEHHRRRTCWDNRPAKFCV